MTLKWRDESRFPKSKVDPDIALVEMERIRICNEGKLTPEALVRESEPKEAVLHPLFEWRNAVAANEYRLWQARTIVKSVRVVYVNEENKKVEQPYYVPICKDTESGKKEHYYQSAEIAVQRPDEWLSALSIMQGKLSSAQKSLAELERIAGKSEDRDRLARLAIAARALETASEALRH